MMILLRASPSFSECFWFLSLILQIFSTVLLWFSFLLLKHFTLFHTFEFACFILLSPLVSYFWVRLFLTFKFACLLRSPYRNLVLLVVGQLPVKKGLTWPTNFLFFYFFLFHSFQWSSSQELFVTTTILPFRLFVQ